MFRNRISSNLESFPAIGVGRTVDWYHPDYSVEDTASGTGTIWFFADTPTASCETSFAEAQATSPDSAYKHDLNTMYAIRAADGKKYSNLEEVLSLIHIYDGDGIAEEDIPHIFDRFYMGRSGKSGIGLALTKEIIHLHRGTIRAYNGETGAVFEISIPVSR